MEEINGKQKRQYKPRKKKSPFAFVLLLALAVFAAAFATATFARCGVDGVPVGTEQTASLSETAEPTTEEPTTVEPTTAEPTTVEPTTAEPTTAEPTEASAVTAEVAVSGETTDVTTTFTSVSEEEGVRRIENFIFYETDTPEYRLARLLYCEVPAVVKTAEVTETVASEESTDPAESVQTTEETTAQTTGVCTDEDGNVIETTVATYTYEVEGYAALYYKDLSDGEVMVFSPNKKIFGASMIKAVYVFALLQLAEREEIDLSEEIVYTEDMFVEGSGDFKNVKSGTVFTVEDLIARTVRRSDNTAFYMLQKRFGTAFFAGIMEENSLSNTRFGSWWRTNVSEYGKFFTVLANYINGENKYGAWLGENMCESLQRVMLQNALRPEKVAHKYGWDEDSYCDGAVVISDAPYVLVFMSNLDEGHLKAANTRFIYEVGGIVKSMHDAKHAPAETTVTGEVQ